MKLKRILSGLCVLGFAGMAFAIATPPSPFQNGGFEVGAPTCAAYDVTGSNLIPGWTVSVGTVDWVSTACNWNASEGTHSLDLIGGPVSIGGVEQTFATILGATYQVSFDLAGNPSTGFPPVKQLAVTVAGSSTPGFPIAYIFDTTGKTPTNMGWITKTFTFVATGSSSTIKFVSDMTPGTFAGAALDNVRIQLLPGWSGTTWTGDPGNVILGIGNPNNVVTGSAIPFPFAPPTPNPEPVLPIVCSGPGSNWGASGGALGSGPFGFPPAVVSSGAAGPAILSYNASLPGDGTGMCGNWTFSTVAIVDGTVALNWSYGGFHSFFAATAELSAFIIRSGTIVWTQSLVSGGPAWCGACNPPSGGFGYSGQVFPPGVQVGDTYGFVMSGSHYDGTDELRGTLTVTGTLPTTTSLTSSANPGTEGIAVSLTATVTGNNPTGFVNFTDSMLAIGGCTGVPVNAGQAVCTQSLAAGTHSINAYYTGDDLHLASATAFTQTILAPAAPTTTSLAGSPNPATVGNAVTFTATVTGTNPGGTVNFIDGVPSLPGCGAVSFTGGAGNTRTAVCTTSSLAAGPHTITALYNGDANNQFSSGSTVQVINAAPVLAAPSLIRVVANTGNDATVIGRVDGAPGASITFQAFSASSCNAGALVGGGAVGSPVTVSTTTDGYFFATVLGVTTGNFVAVQLTSPAATAMSACLVSSADNDFWSTALLVGNVPVRGYIDAPGKARWYKFSVAPGQRIGVTLSGLPADYDLTVFKDIGAAFAAQLVPATPTALAKLSAEFAPSAFSPSAFSPSAFSPSAFSPSAFSPSAFSPSAFSANVYSPSAFSPSAFSPSAFSPSAFSPSAFSPSAFSPSAFSPSEFNPSAFSPFGSGVSAPSAFSLDAVNKAFSSAQTRSIIAVSATPGTSDESAVVASWNNSGYFYARVAGRGGAFSTSGQFTISVAKSGLSCVSVTDTTLTPRVPAARTGIKTVILTDLSKVPLGAKLAEFAARGEIGGVVVDVNADARVRALNVQAANNASCPFATNLVAEEIKGIVDSYRANNPGLRYVVIAGGDDVIPFFRYPDESLIGQESGYVPPVSGASDASLRGDYILSQDAYGSATRISLRTSDFPIPGLAVGRLVKTPAEIAGLIDAYAAANGAVRPGSSLVTGYDFLADAADAVTAELLSGTGVAPDRLVTASGVSPQDPASWIAKKQLPGQLPVRDSLEEKLLGSTRHDVVFLAGHFSANSALAADFTTNLITTDLAASTTDFTNSIVFSAGCHSGYSIVNNDALTGVTLTLDWAQAFAQKKATLIAGTGYQYGDTDFIEYSERLYVNFAKQLHAGNGAIPVGEALVKAKLDYLAATPDIRGIHEKALLEATLYGLPMLGVDMPSGRGGGSGNAGVITPSPVLSGPASILGLRIAELPLSPSLTPHTLQLKDAQGVNGPMATWLSGSDGVVSNPAEPALPINIVNVTPTDGSIVMRGVGFRGGSYTDSEIVPLTGAPTTEIRGVHVPFASPYFFPMRTWTVNYFGALGGNGSTKLLVTPAQHRAANLSQGTSTLRQFTSLNLRLYYSNNLTQASLSSAPTIVAVDAQPISGGVAFTAQVVGDPAAAIHQVWITYADGGGTWNSLDLAQCVAAACGTTVDSNLWKGTLANSPPNLQYVVQAANGVGLVSLDDNRGGYYAFAGAQPAATTLAFVSPPASAAYGGNATVSATLSGGSNLQGKTIMFAVGGASNTATTNNSGVATAVVPVTTLPGNYQIVASFAGDGNALASSASTPAGSFVVTRAPSNLSVFASGAYSTTLTASVGGQAQQLLQRSVKFTLAGATTKDVYVETDHNGVATLPAAGVSAGTYNVTAYYTGDATYAPFPPQPGGGSVVGSVTVQLQTITVVASGGSSLPDVINLPGSATFAATSNAGQPVAFVLSPPAGPNNPVCSLTNSGTGYTLNALSPGTCTLVASAPGTTTFAGGSVTRNITIAKGDTATSLAPSANPAQFGQPVTLTATLNPTVATGTVQFFDGALAIGAPAMLSNGVATVTFSGASGLRGGGHAFTAAYSGDGKYNVSNSSPLSLTVNPAPTTTAIVSSVAPANSTQFGQPVTLTATITPAALLPAAATGTVQFFDGATAIGGSVPLANGIATVTLSGSSRLGVGNHPLRATYSGDGNYATSGSTVTLSVGPAATTNSLTSSANPSVVGQPVTLTATVAAIAPSVGTPTGNVNFMDGATILGGGPVNLVGGRSSLSTNAFAVGTHSLTAVYADSTVPPNYTGSSAALALTVNQMPTTTTLTSDKASPVRYGTTINLTAAVTPGTATGTVTFLEGNAVLATAALSGGTPTTSAKASMATSTLAVGTHMLTARYAGDTNDAGSPSVPLTVTISEAFKPTGSMLKARTGHTAILLNDGRVLVAGGSSTTGGDNKLATRTAEIYCPDPYTPPTTPARTLAQWCPNGVGKFSPAGRGNTAQVGVGNMVQARSFHSATRLPGGTVLIAGGFDSSGSLTATAEIYSATDPIADRFTAVANLPSNATAGHTATLITKNTKVLVLVAGGTSAASQLYDPATKSWTRSGSMTGARFNHTATAVGTKVFVAGGTDLQGRTLQTTTIYDIGTGTFASGPTMLAPREWHTASVIANGKVLLAGGSAGSGILNHTVALNVLAEIYDPSNATTPFVASSFASGTGRFAHSASALIAANGQPDGRILVTGGGVNVLCGQQLATSELFASGAFTTGAAMTAARVLHTATVLNDGRVLVAGGWGATGSTCGPLNTAEIWYGPPSP